MRFTLVLVLVFLPSCSLYRSLTENSELVRGGLTKVGDVVADVKTKYDEIVPMIGAITKQVEGLTKDQDGDGDVDFTDLLLGLGGLGVVGGGAAAARNKKSNDAKIAERERAKLAEADIDKRLALMEAKNAG